MVIEYLLEPPSDFVVPILTLATDPLYDSIGNGRDSVKPPVRLNRFFDRCF